MRRREFVALLGSGVAGWPLTARAQQAVSAVKVGWIEGRNLAIDYRSGDADPKRIPNYAII
jgi:hypothetical protein